MIDHLEASQTRPAWPGRARHSGRVVRVSPTGLVDPSRSPRPTRQSFGRKHSARPMTRFWPASSACGRPNCVPFALARSASRNCRVGNRLYLAMHRKSLAQNHKIGSPSSV